jgi:cyanophycinase-like exopeptidase
VDRFPDCLGLGIDEQTAVVVQGRIATVLGDRQVHVCFPGQNLAQVYRSGQRIALDPLVAGTR